MKDKTSRVALVTGGQRGLGLETCRGLAKLGYTVVLTSPVISTGRTAASALGKDGFDVHFQELDVTVDADIKRVKDFVKKRFGRLDALVNNAGILVDEGKSILKVPIKTIQHVMNVNTFGAVRMCQAFVPLMIRRDYGRIVNVASGRGQLSGEDIGDYGPAYNMSKTAVNALTVMLADRLADTNILVNSVCPGWCRTRLGGPEAPRSARKGAETIVWLATQPNGGPSGRFFRDKHELDW